MPQTCPNLSAAGCPPAVNMDWLPLIAIGMLVVLILIFLAVR